MSNQNHGSDWQRAYREGRLKTPYIHFTLVTDGQAGVMRGDFDCPPGPAFMSIKVWAPSANQAIRIAQDVGLRLGFRISGMVQIFETVPDQQPGEKPSAYDVQFASVSAV